MSPTGLFSVGWLERTKASSWTPRSKGGARHPQHRWPEARWRTETMVSIEVIGVGGGQSEEGEGGVAMGVPMMDGMVRL